MPDQIAVHVSEASQAGEARRTAVRMAEAAGLNETARGKVAIVATEFATNLIRHARDGRVLIQTLRTPSDGPMIEMISLDHGPGMPDVARCLEDGYSTAGTPGNGLGAIRRQSDLFDIESTVDLGTVVLSRIGDGSRGTVRPSRQFVWGAISVPAPRETLCGDTWRVTERENEIGVMVADGLGHGPLANEASETAARCFDVTAFEEPRLFLERTNPKLSGTRGAAAAAGRGSALSHHLSYAGVGNIAGYLLHQTERRGLFTQNGTMGTPVRNVKQFEYPWAPDGVLVMHSDGLQTRWGAEKYPGLLRRHPAVIAAVLCRDFTRGPDDTTVVVIRMGER